MGELKQWYIYVIKTESGFYKIGMSRDPYDRHSQLLPGIPESSNVQLMIKCASKEMARELEAKLHKDLANWNTVGEWFKVPKVTLALLIFDLGKETRAMDLRPPEISYHDEPWYKIMEENRSTYRKEIENVNP